ncbi:MAG: DUF4112 domain-containing protein [Deltaproteobacteria bacterium]|nr:DUF4112 domain-containing protein [Deltaproteobacteria bacterium]
MTVAKWTDARFVDPLLGLVLPGVGDVLGAAAGLYIVMIAVRHGAPRTVVARMLFNLSIDCLGGVVPIVGDLFDALNRANVRNVRLLQQHVAAAPTPAPAGIALSGTTGLAFPIVLLVAAVGLALAFAYFVASRWSS